jgi:PIN domain nuclease of toxin-antitoxin system
MNLLLDTHIALWAVTDSPQLPQQANTLIASADNNVWISVASIWEISIKHALGRGDMPVSGQEALNYFRSSGYQILNIQAQHVIATSALEPHHKDPFDRLLAAQAQTERMQLLTSDSQVAKYGPWIMLL